MPSFHSAREAKDFLVTQIVQEAKRENVPLSEVERKMLYFSESYESLPDIAEVADQFAAKYDDDEYEAKITRLIKSTYRRLGEESPGDLKTWQEAVKYLQKEDHYILVMMDGQQTDSEGWSNAPSAGWKDRLKLLATGLALVVAGVFVFFLFQFLGLTRSGRPELLPSILSDDARGKIVVAGMVLAAIYVLYDYLFPRSWQGKLKRK